VTEHGNGNGESPPEDWAETMPPEWGEPVSIGGRGMPDPEVEASASEIADQRLRAVLAGFSATRAFDRDGRANPPPPRKFAVPELLPLATNGLFVGYGGIGKGLLTLQMAHHIALGLPLPAVRWPDGGSPEPILLQPDAPRGVLLVGKEDDEEEMLRRIIACNAARYGSVWEGSIGPDELELFDRHLQLVCLPVSVEADERFLRLLIERARQVPDIGWIIIDPLGRFLFRDPDGSLPKFIAGEYAAAVTNFSAELAQETGACVTPVAHMSAAGRRASKEGGETGRSVVGVPYGSELLLSWARFSLGLEDIKGNDLEDLGLSPGRNWLRVALGKANYGDTDIQVIFERIGGAVRPVDIGLAMPSTGYEEMPAEKSPGEMSFFVGEDVTVTRVAKALTGKDTNPNGRQRTRGERLLRLWASRGWVEAKGSKWRIKSTGTGKESDGNA